jgi:vesicle-fusing ATPase
MLDPALLRPGRLEVHIEIGLPDEAGRLQILNIHTTNMSRHNKLSPDVDLAHLAQEAKNFSGAELEGLVKSASSFALAEGVDPSKGDIKIDPRDIVVTQAHFEMPLREVRPAFGVAEDDLRLLAAGPLLPFSPKFSKIMEMGRTLIDQLSSSPKTTLLSLLLEGCAGSGKSAIAGSLALQTRFPFARVISPHNFVGLYEHQKCAAIKQVFEDAWKTPRSCIVLDDIERLLDYVSLGPHFSNAVLQTLLVLVKKAPPKPDHKIFIIATTGSKTVLDHMDLRPAFNVVKHVPAVTSIAELTAALTLMGAAPTDEDMKHIAPIPNLLPIGIKRLRLLVDMVAASDPISQNTRPKRSFAARFTSCAHDAGF